LKRLLIVKLSSIGDVLHALPVVKSIKHDLPDLEIGWVVRERCASLLAGVEFVDHVHVIKNKPGLKDLLNLSNELKGIQYDTVFDMQGLLLSGVVTVLSGASRRVGLNRNREFNKAFLTEANVEGRAPLKHAIDVQLGFRASAGLLPISELPALTHLGRKSQEWLDSFEAKFDASKVIVLNVGASTIYKRWPNEYWVELANQLIRLGFQTVLTAGPSETADADAIEAAIGSKERLINLGGKTTSDQLAAILGRSDLVVTGDTGPMHLAASMGTPTVALFGPTDPRLTGPYGSNHKVIWKQLSCSPCFRHPTCNGRVDCLKAITAGDVLSAIQSLLQEQPRGALV